MRAVSVVFLLAVAFPYTQFLPLDTYTQPYALLLAFLIVASRLELTLRRVPQIDFVALFGLLCLGLCTFLMTCFPYTDLQELKYLLNYGAPLLQTLAVVVTVRAFPQLSRRTIEVAVVVWFVVAAIQSFIAPTFLSGLVGAWSEAAEVVVASGRGVLGLAPEPTHHAFHVLLLGAALVLLRSHWIFVLLCVIDAILLARSSSAILALAMGAGLFAVLQSRKFAIALVAFIAALPFLLRTLQAYAPEDTRILVLASGFLESPMDLLVLDYSVNARIGGALAAFIHSFQSFLLPQGMSHEHWLATSRLLLQDFHWLLGISTVGPPSGFGVILFQTGFLGALLLLVPVLRIAQAPVRGAGKILVLSALFIFLGQYYISATTFALLYGCVIHARLVASRERQRVSSDAVPPPAAVPA